MNKLEKAFTLFDGYNRQDPEQISYDGKQFPAEYFYALQVYRRVLELDPSAHEALLLASRSQHIGRWEIARESYSAGKTGYLNWRIDLAKYHADKASELLELAGYDQEIIERTRQIILKQRIKLDPDVQTMENALCLVFLEFQFEDFMKKHDEQKMINIVRKTWKKMSDPGREAALALHFSEAAADLLKKALN